MAVQPLTLKPRHAASHLTTGRAIRATLPFTGSHSRVSQKTLVEFTRGFSVMISARLTLLQALETATSQCRDKRLERTLLQIKADVQRGWSLSASLARHPATFDHLYVQLVKVGEAAGVLDTMLLRLATYLEKTATLKRKIRLALVYPSVIVTVAISAIVVLLTVVVPTFAEMFADFGAELPVPTRIILQFSNVISAYFFLIVGGIGLLGCILVSLKKAPRGKALWDRFVLKVPLTGDLLQKSLVARFCRTLGTLLQGGVPLVEALKILPSVTDNQQVEDTIHAMTNGVTRGGRLSQPLAQAKVFPAMVIQMITVGEETAQLDEMLFHIAEHYEQQVDASVESLTSIIEPVLIVILGLILGSILIAMYLPMFDLVNVVGG